MCANKPEMCFVANSRFENYNEKEESDAKDKDILLKNGCVNGQIHAKIRYFELLPIFQVQEDKSNKPKLYNYKVRVKDIVKHFQLVREPTLENGTSLYFLKSVEMKHHRNSHSTSDLDLEELDQEESERARAWSFAGASSFSYPTLHQSQRKRKKTIPILEQSYDTSRQNIVEMRKPSDRDKLTYNKHNRHEISDCDHCSTTEIHNSKSHQYPHKDADEEILWRGTNENYQTYSLKSDNLLSSQIKNRYNSTTYLEFTQFYLTRNGKKRLSVKFTDEDDTILDFVTGPREILWQKLPKVINSGLLNQMTRKQIKYQEALFEIIYTEARYHHSLTILQNSFIQQLRANVPSVISEKTFNIIFSKIQPILEWVHLFNEELKLLLQSDEMLQGLGDIIKTHYHNSWNAYLKYAGNSETILNTYNRELTENLEFFHLVNEITNRPETEKLPLDSFLSLPIQRITKMPLLLKSVITQADETSSEYSGYVETLGVAQELAKECDAKLREMKECEDMLKIVQELEFPHQLHLFPLLKSSRRLCLRSQVRRLTKNHLIHRKENIEMFLFNDLFLYAKRHHGCKRLTICDYGPREELTIVRNTHIHPSELQFLLRVDSHQKELTLLVAFDLMSERQRWVTALTPPAVCDNESKRSENKQVIVIKKYHKKRPDELSLEIGDVILIIDENGEWCNGKRMADGDIGWFPIVYCHIITSDRIRSINSLLCIGIGAT